MDIGYNYKPGTKLLLELVHGEQFAGNVRDCEDDQITLIKVYDYLTQTEGTSNFPLHFYKMEIRSIIILEEVHEPPRDEQSFFEKNHEKLDMIIRNFSYITEKGPSFKCAIECIQSCNIISMAALVTYFGRGLPLSLLGVGTRDKVFLFDLKLIGPTAFEHGLKEILESNEVLKVVHSCSKLADSLYHNHNVTLRYVFDTQVADKLVSFKENSTVRPMSRILKECLRHYFGVPESVTNFFSINLMSAHSRPCSEHNKMSVAIQAVYLLKLKQHLEAKMLTGFNVAMDFQLNFRRNATLSDAWKMNRVKVPQQLHDLKPKPLEYRKPLFTRTSVSNADLPSTSQSTSTTDQITQISQSLNPLRLSNIDEEEEEDHEEYTRRFSTFEPEDSLLSVHVQKSAQKAESESDLQSYNVLSTTPSGTQRPNPVQEPKLKSILKKSISTKYSSGDPGTSDENPTRVSLSRPKRVKFATSDTTTRSQD